MIGNHQPLVTALVPTYNGAAFIGRTLESLARQTWPRLEILVGDVASTVSHRQICLRDLRKCDFAADQSLEIGN